MASDPVIRQQVLDAIPEGKYVSADNMWQLRDELGMKCALGKLRRAISSLNYEHKQLRLHRPSLGEGLGRGWGVSR